MLKRRPQRTYQLLGVSPGSWPSGKKSRPGATRVPALAKPECKPASRVSSHPQCLQNKSVSANSNIKLLKGVLETPFLFSEGA